MKKTIFAAIAILLLFGSCIVYVPTDVNRGPYNEPYQREPVRDYRDVTIGYFYDYLTPYGAWVSLSPHGYVWIPRHMGYRWRPYTLGHWIWTDYGWMWMSEEEWGWACFHYGRWGWEDDIGWFWVPGNVWAPAWVIWRSSPDYFGWAPIPPGVEFDLRFGFRWGNFDMPGRHWVFVESRYFAGRRLDDYILPFERNTTIIGYSQLHRNIDVRNNRVINEGIDLVAVERATRTKISRQEVGEARRPGPAREDLNRVTVYKPSVGGSESGAPKRYLNKDEARDDLRQAQIWDPKRPEDQDTTVVRKRFDQEARILERSQLDEQQRLRDRYVQQEGKARDSVEKDRIRKEQTSALNEMKKRHDEEKKDLSNRQKQDEEQIKKRIVKK
jgi:hypothetical protein